MRVNESRPDFQRTAVPYDLLFSENKNRIEMADTGAERQLQSVGKGSEKRGNPDLYSDATVAI